MLSNRGRFTTTRSLVAQREGERHLQVVAHPAGAHAAQAVHAGRVGGRVGPGDGHGHRDDEAGRVLRQHGVVRLGGEQRAGQPGRLPRRARQGCGPRDRLPGRCRSGLQRGAALDGGHQRGRGHVLLVPPRVTQPVVAHPVAHLLQGQLRRRRDRIDRDGVEAVFGPVLERRRVPGRQRESAQGDGQAQVRAAGDGCGAAVRRVALRVQRAGDRGQAQPGRQLVQPGAPGQRVLHLVGAVVDLVRRLVQGGLRLHLGQRVLERALAGRRVLGHTEHRPSAAGLLRPGHRLRGRGEDRSGQVGRREAILRLILQLEGGGMGRGGLLLHRVPVRAGQPGAGDRLRGRLRRRHDHLDAARGQAGEIGLVALVVRPRVGVADLDLLRHALGRQDHHLDAAVLRCAVEPGVVVVLPRELLVGRGGRLCRAGEGQGDQVRHPRLPVMGEHQAVDQLRRDAAGAHRLHQRALPDVGPEQAQVARFGVAVLPQHAGEDGAVELAVRPLEGGRVEGGPAQRLVRHADVEPRGLGGEGGHDDQPVQRPACHHPALLGRGRGGVGIVAHDLDERAAGGVLELGRGDLLAADGGDGVWIDVPADQVARDIRHAPQAEGGDQQHEEYLGRPGAGKSAEGGEHGADPEGKAPHHRDAGGALPGRSAASRAGEGGPPCDNSSPGTGR